MGRKSRRHRVEVCSRESGEGAGNGGGGAWRGHALAVAALAVLVAVYYRDYLTGVRFIQDDALRWYYPVVSSFCAAMAEGRFPLWTDAILCGMPIYSDVQASYFYPPLWLLLPFAGKGGLPFLAYQWYLVLHILMGGGFMYLFLARHRAGPLAGLLGAVVFCFAGFMSLHVIHVPMLQVYAWLPLQLVLVEKCVAGRRVRDYALLVVALLIGLFAGFPQVMLYNSLFLAAYWIYEAWRTGPVAHGTAPWGEVRRLIGEMLRVGGVFALVLLLGAVMILPAIENWRLSHREAWGYARISDQSLPWRMLVHLAVPNFFGRFSGGDDDVYFWGHDSSVHEVSTYGYAPWQYHEFGAYAGQLALVAFSGLLWDWKRLRRHCALFFVAGSVVALWFMLGRYGGLFGFLYHAIPGVSMFRGPSRMACVLDFCFAAMVGFFVASWAGGASSRPWRPVLGVLLLYAAVLLWHVGWAVGRYSELENPVLGSFAVRESWVCLAFFLGSAMCLGGIRAAASGPERWAWGVALAVLAFSDLRHAYGHFHRGRDNPEAYFNRSPAVVEAVKEAAERTGPLRFVQRVNGVGPSEYLWDQNAPFLHRELESPRGMSTFVLRDYRVFQNIRNEETRLDIQNVRMYSTPDFAKNQVSLFLRDTSLARAELFLRIKPFDSIEEIVRDLESGAIDHRRTLAVLGSELDEGAAPVVFNPLERTTPVGLTRISPERWRIRYKSAHGGVIFLSKAFYPGWEATGSDGRSYRLIRAFAAFTGIVIPGGGEDEIDLNFRPASLKQGAAISMGTALGLAAVLQFMHRRGLRGLFGIR